MEHDGDGDTNYDWCTWKIISKGAEGLENKRTSRDHPDCNIIKIGQNTETSPGDLRRLAITQTPVKDPQLTLLRKTHKGVNNDDVTYYNQCARNGPQRLAKETGRVENWRTSRECPNYTIVENGQNTQKRTGDGEDLLSLRLHWGTISKRWCEKPARRNVITIILETM